MLLGRATLARHTKARVGAPTGAGTHATRRAFSFKDAFKRAQARAERPPTTQTGQFVQSQVEAGSVNFAIGQPSPRLLPATLFRQAMGSLGAEPAAGEEAALPMLLQYGTARGFADFRAALASFLSRRYGFTVEADGLLLTNGNSHGVQFALRNIVAHARKLRAAGSSETCVVAMDDPTYFLVGDIVKQEPNVESLARELQGDVSGKRLVALYCVPMHHNPTGVSMLAERAQRLVQLAHEHDFYVLADEPYPLLSFPSEAGAAQEKDATSLKAYERGLDAGQPSRVVSLGTFSKIVAPGLRLGWLHADEALVEQLCTSDPVLRSGGCPNPVVAGLVHQMLLPTPQAAAPTLLDKYLDDTRTVFAQRCGALCLAMEASFGGLVSFERPHGGYFLWVRFAEGTGAGGTGALDTSALAGFLETRQEQYRVQFLPGARCSVTLPGDSTRHNDNTKFRDCIRLSWAFHEEAELVDGVRRLRLAYDDFRISGAVNTPLQYQLQ